jgi:hypothetical protein
MNARTGWNAGRGRGRDENFERLGHQLLVWSTRAVRLQLDGHVPNEMTIFGQVKERSTPSSASPLVSPSTTTSTAVITFSGFRIPQQVEECVLRVQNAGAFGSSLAARQQDTWFNGLIDVHVATAGTDASSYLCPESLDMDRLG